jgi:Domain of unknown function (DUF5667)
VIADRRARRFHELVENGSRAPSMPEYAGLLEVVGALRAVPTPVADPTFVTTLRDRLVAEAESVLVSAAADRDESDARLRLRPTTPQSRRRHRRLAALVSGLALAGASATIAVAAQTALPGDTLYPVKRGLEGAHAELTFDRADRGRLLLHDAGTRLDEVQELSREHADPSRVDAALVSFTQQAVTGSDLLVADYDATGDRSSMTSLRTFTASSMGRLNVLQAEVPPQSLDALLQAAQALDQVQATSLVHCPSCTGPLIGSLPGVLAQAVEATAQAWTVPATRHHHGGAQDSDGAPQRQTAAPTLPTTLPTTLPPASVTDPGTTSGGDPSTGSAPTAVDVRHTVQHLADGLRSKHQNDGASTVSDAANNLLDAVGAVGNQVAGALDGTVDGRQSILPTLP